MTLDEEARPTADAAAAAAVTPCTAVLLATAPQRSSDMRDTVTLCSVHCANHVMGVMAHVYKLN